MTHETLVEKLSRHVSIIQHNQAEHCGAHHIVFTAREHQLRRLLKACHFAHAHIAVHLNEAEEIIYSIAIPASRGDVLLEWLDGDKHQQMYLELTYSSGDANRALFDRFCLKCCHAKEYCRCENHRG